MDDTQIDEIELKYNYFYEIFEKDPEDSNNSLYNNDDTNKFTWSEI